MTDPSEILYRPDWRAIFAGLALLVSLYSLYYTRFRQGDLLFACSKWTALGASTSSGTGAAFALNIEMQNTGARPITLYDFMLEAETPNGKLIFYDPVFLFSLKAYMKAMGQPNQIGQANNGAVPLPVIIPGKSSFKFPCEILFMPHDKKTTVQIPSDTPFKLRLFTRKGGDKYSEVALQRIEQKDVQNLKNGSFSGVLSTASIDERSQFIKKRCS